MAKTLQDKIDELLGRLEMSGSGGGVMSQLDTPANAVQDAHRERYLMDMFSGTNPDTGESFLEPAETEYQKKLRELRGFAKESGMSNDELTQRQLALLGAGAYGGYNTGGSNPYSDKTLTIKFLADQMGMTVQEFLATGQGARGLATPAMRDAFLKQKYSTGATDKNLGFGGERGFETPAMRDTAHRVLSRLSEAEYRDVMEILPNLSAEQYMAFMAGLENGSINPSGYEVQEQNRLMRPY